MSIDLLEADRLLSILQHEGGTASAATNNPNISPLVFTNEDDLESLLSILNFRPKVDGKAKNNHQNQGQTQTRERQEGPVELSRNEAAMFQNLALATLRYCLFSGNDSILEKTRKNIILNGLLPLANLNIINSSQSQSPSPSPPLSTPSSSAEEAYVLSALSVLVDSVMIDVDTNATASSSGNASTDTDAQSKNKSESLGLGTIKSLESSRAVNTAGIESLLPGYILSIKPEQACSFVNKLCSFSRHDNVDQTSKGQSNIKVLNPHAAAAVASSLKEIYSLQLETQSHSNHMVSSTSSSSVSNKRSKTSADPIPTTLLTLEHFTSLVQTLFRSLRILSINGEYDSIPPLIYQLCGLTKFRFPSSPLSSLPLTILIGIADFFNGLDRKKEPVRWAICTSLVHLGRILRNNPILPNVLLQLVKGKDRKSTSITVSVSTDPLRHRGMTPMLLAMGLTMASSIPRMKNSLLEAVRDLVLEEEMVRCKRFSSPWVNSAMALLIHGNGDNDTCEALLEDVNGYLQEIDESEALIRLEKKSFMLQCMKSLVRLADGGDEGEDAWNGGSAGRGDSSFSDAEFSSLYPTLISLGFMLVDSVKRDSVAPQRGNVGAHKLPPLPNCSSEASRNSTYSIQQKSNANAARIGRSLLVYLFLRLGGSKDDEGIIVDSGFSRTALSSPQCRSILMTACEKFCSMAPNAIEHSYLLKELVTSDGKNQYISDTISSYGEGEEGLGAQIVEEAFIPMIIDLLANLPGGGMPPLVASRSIIPVLDKLLKLGTKKSKRNRRKRDELNAHIDHCFLLAKKALFCTDIERRRVAVNLLVMLVTVSVESSMNLFDEVRGYLRRCMTQYQYEVRLEVYVALVASIPDSVQGGDNCEEVHAGSALSRKVSAVTQILLGHLEKYITIEEEKTVIDARRKRAMTHGTHLSQQEDMEEDNNDEHDEHASDNDVKDAPLRLDLCTASVRSSSTSTGRQLGNKRKKKSSSPDLLSEAVGRISEPISFLLSSCMAVVGADQETSSERQTTNALFDILTTLKANVSASGLDHYLKDCKRKGDDKSVANEDAVNIISICLLVASVSETLMALPDRSKDTDFDCILKLFRLRMDAISKGAAVLSNIKTRINKGKKKVCVRSSAEKDNVEVAEDDLNSARITDCDTVDPKSKTMEKFKIAMDKAASGLCPSMPSTCISQYLRECGTLGQSKARQSGLYSTEDNENGNAKDELNVSVDFRRFLLENSQLLLSGQSVIIKAGSRFDIFVDPRNIGRGEDVVGMTYVAASFALGPVLLAEHFTHVQNRRNTSLVDQLKLPLSQLALDGFISSARRMLSYVRGHQLNPKQRIKNFVRASLQVVFDHFPSIKERWNLVNLLPADMLQSIPNTDTELLRSLYTLSMPMTVKADEPGRAQGGLLSEFIVHGLDVEAAGWGNLMKCILHHMSPMSRQIIGLTMLHCFNYPDVEITKEGIIGLDHGDDGVDCQKCASTVVDAAIYLDGLLDGGTEDPLIPPPVENRWRTYCGFTTINPDQIKRITGRAFISSEFHSLDKDNLLGIVSLLSSSLLVSNGADTNFDESILENKAKYLFTCTDVLSSSKASDNLVSKELTNGATAISSSLESGLCDVEFIASKVLPHISPSHMVLLQSLLINRLYAVGKVICASAPCASKFDNTASFVALLLKSCKRLYAIYTKLLGYLSEDPKATLTVENRRFLLLLSGKLNTRTMALLLTLQEYTKVGTKMLADSKISSQGRIAAQVVFELERCDNALLKFGSKLKSRGLYTESNFLQGKVGSSTTIRDFRIEKEKIQAARERQNRESHLKEAKRTKRKNKMIEKKKKKQATKERADMEDSVRDDDGSQGADDNSIVGDLDEYQSSAVESGRPKESDDDQESEGNDSIMGAFIVDSASDSAIEESASEDDSESV